MRVLFKHPDDDALTVSNIDYCSFEENAKCDGAVFAGLYFSYGDSVEFLAIMNKHESDLLCEQTFRTGLLDLTGYHVIFTDDETAENKTECNKLTVF